MLRSWIRYLVILILMGILALLYNTNVTFVLFFACLALPAGLFVLGILFATPLPERLYQKVEKKWIGSAAVLVLLGLSMYYLTISTNNPFMYFNF